VEVVARLDVVAGVLVVLELVWVVSAGLAVLEGNVGLVRIMSVELEVVGSQDFLSQMLMWQMIQVKPSENIKLGVLHPGVSVPFWWCPIVTRNLRFVLPAAWARGLANHPYTGGNLIQWGFHAPSNSSIRTIHTQVSLSIVGPAEPQRQATLLSTPYTGTIPKISTATNPDPPQPSMLEVALAKLIEHQTQTEAINRQYLERLNESISNISINHDPISPRSPHQRQRLPPLSVPDFTGDATEWMNFRDMYTSIIDRDPNLSNVQKLQYLMTYVKDNAKKLIHTLSITDNNYSVAWDILREQYDHKFTVIHCHVDQFFKLSIVPSPTLAAITELYVGASSVLNSLDTLNESGRDPWVIYLLLSKLDQESKQLWSQEASTTMPTCEEFMAFLSKRIRSLGMCQTTPDEPRETITQPSKPSSSRSRPFTKHTQASVLAAAATNPCPACNQSDHKVYKYPTFLRKSAPERLAFVRQRGLCRKCLINTHATIECTFYPSLTDVHKWNHVPTDANPADIISRGMYPVDLLKSSLWWNGPQFITHPVSQWPIDPSRGIPAPLAVATISDKKDTHPIETILTRHNGFHKVTRILAYILRISSKTKPTSSLTPLELVNAERKLISYAPLLYFSASAASSVLLLRKLKEAF
uniref:Uncharacterized protein n=1 Tax=Phlebotomus papatasi TaxID=29031 RepID=A0A1B0DFT0_PHLPP